MLSQETLSTLTDMWAELQTSAVEAVQAPTLNLFSFAESSLFFAVILQNNPLPGGGQIDPNGNELLDFIDDERFERVIKRSTRDVCAQSQASSSSSTLVPPDAVSWGLWDEFTDIGAEGTRCLDPFAQTETELESYDWRNASPNRPTSLSFRQHEPPTSSFPAHGSFRNAVYSASTTYIDNIPELKQVIGMVYLTRSPHNNVPAGEANIGIILTPKARGKGLAREATSLVLSWVFDGLGIHRVQASILDNHAKDRAVSMFTQCGFIREGIGRRSIYCPNEGVRGAWKDVTYLALLDTEWFMRSYLNLAPKNIWDEMFARHGREREELLRWDDREQRLKRTSSAETVRAVDASSATDEETGHSLKRPLSMETLQDPDTSSKTAPGTDEKTSNPSASDSFASDFDAPSVYKGKRGRLEADPPSRQSQASSPRKFSCVIM